ncbi:LITTLE ZIPPER 2-like protein [Drosera capensis]
MCCGAIEGTPYLRHQYGSCKKHRRVVRTKVQVHGLFRRKCEGKKSKNMELRNLKLYLQNRSIKEENEKLRKKAILLGQENEALLSEFQKKFSISGSPSSVFRLGEHNELSKHSCSSIVLGHHGLVINFTPQATQIDPQESWS